MAFSHRLWPVAAAPGPAALWWAINSRQNSSSNGVGRQLSVASESVEWLQDEGFSDDDASSLRQEEEEPNWEVSPQVYRSTGPRFHWAGHGNSKISFSA
eukprot:1157439-Pelagomonas_calceolata.AAC.2